MRRKETEQYGSSISARVMNSLARFTSLIRHSLYRYAADSTIAGAIVVVSMDAFHDETKSSNNKREGERERESASANL